MTKFSILAITALVIVGIASFYFITQNSRTAQTEQLKSSSQQESTIVADAERINQEPVVQSEGAEISPAVTSISLTKYQPYSENIPAVRAADTRVLFFYANWCPTCQSADTSISENTTKIPANVSIIRVNYNDNETDAAEKELARKYGITYQHTYVQIDAEGSEITKWNGGGVSELVKNIQ